MKRKVLIITAASALLLLIGLPSLTTKEYNVHIPDFNDINYCENVICEGVGCAKTNAQIQQDIEDRNNLVKVNYLDLNYNQDAKRLTVEAEIDTTTGKTTNFFHLVLTSGDLDISRKNCEASVGHLYVDFTDELNPKVNVFAFNGHLNLYCNNGEIHEKQNVTHNGFDSTFPLGDGTGPYVNKASLKESFYARTAPYYREEIFSSVDQPDKVSFSIDNTATTKIIHLELDVSGINEHQVEPLLLRNKSYTYEGIKFAERVGVWFWAAANAVPTYTDNYISSLLTQKTDCSTCVHPELETKSRVLCGASNVTINPVEIGQSTTLTFEVINEDYFDTEKAPVIISYSGLPAGAKPNVPNGQEVIFEEDATNGKATIKIDWTPTKDQAGDYTIGADFLVEYGLNNLQTECTAVKVKVNSIIPECKQADLKAITQADQDMAQLNLISSKIEQRIKKINKQLGIKAKVDDFDPAAENTKGWESYNAIIGQGVYLFECTNIDNCAAGLQTSSLSSELDKFKSAINNLKTIGLSRATKLRKALVKQYVKSGLEVSAARKKATKVVENQYLQGVNNQGINPTYTSATSFVDLHVNAYGLTRFSASNLSSLEETCGLKIAK